MTQHLTPYDHILLQRAIDGTVRPESQRSERENESISQLRRMGLLRGEPESWSRNLSTTMPVSLLIKPVPVVLKTDDAPVPRPRKNVPPKQRKPPGATPSRMATKPTSDTRAQITVHTTRGVPTRTTVGQVPDEPGTPMGISEKQARALAAQRAKELPPQLNGYFDGDHVSSERAIHLEPLLGKDWSLVQVGPDLQRLERLQRPETDR